MWSWLLLQIILVLPLDGLEHNSGWMDQIMGRLLSTRQPIQDPSTAVSNSVDFDSRRRWYNRSQGQNREPARWNMMAPRDYHVKQLRSPMPRPMLHVWRNLQTPPLRRFTQGWTSMLWTKVPTHLMDAILSATAVHPRQSGTLHSARWRRVSASARCCAGIRGRPAPLGNTSG